MTLKADWQKLTQAAGRLAGLNVWIKDESFLEYEAIRKACGRLAAEYNTFGPTGEGVRRIGLIVIDGLQRLRGRRRVRRRLKDIARELMVPIVATMEVTPGDVRDAPQRLCELTEDHADNLCFLHCDPPDGHEDRSQAAELVIVWQANGPTGNIRLRWDSRCLRFEGTRPARPQFEP